MALLEDLAKRNTLTALAVGVGATILAPIVLPAVAQNVRPAAKVTVKGASCTSSVAGRWWPTATREASCGLEPRTRLSLSIWGSGEHDQNALRNS